MRLLSGCSFFLDFAFAKFVLHFQNMKRRGRLGLFLSSSFFFSFFFSLCFFVCFFYRGKCVQITLLPLHRHVYLCCNISWNNDKQTVWNPADWFSPARSKRLAVNGPVCLAAWIDRIIWFAEFLLPRVSPRLLSTTPCRFANAEGMFSYRNGETARKIENQHRISFHCRDSDHPKRGWARRHVASANISSAAAKPLSVAPMATSFPAVPKTAEWDRTEEKARLLVWVIRSCSSGRIGRLTEGTAATTYNKNNRCTVVVCLIFQWKKSSSFMWGSVGGIKWGGCVYR